MSEAETIFTDVLEEKVELWFDYALLACRMAGEDVEAEEKHYLEAAGWLNKIISTPELSDEIYCEAKVTLAEIYQKLALFNKVINLLQPIADLKEYDDSITEYVERARFVVVSCAVQKADELYQALEKKLESIRKYYMTAYNYAKLLEESKSEEFYKFALYAKAVLVKRLSAIDPEFKEQITPLYEQAIAYYKNCIVKNSSDFTALLYRAKCYADIGKYERAEAIAEILPKDIAQMLTIYIEESKADDR